MTNKKYNYRYYNRKMVICGNNITLLSYSNPILRNSNPRADYSKDKEGDKLEKNLNRVRNNIKMIIDCNVSKYSKFITLTFKTACLDKAECLNNFNRFTKRFKKIFGYKLNYLAVLEHQKLRGEKEHNDGSWHIHLICFNQSKIDFDLFANCWDYGIFDIKKIDNANNIGRYLMKYITKEQCNNLNDKSIYTSQGLKRPVIYYDDDIPDIDNDFKLVYSKSYDINIKYDHKVNMFNHSSRQFETIIEQRELNNSATLFEFAKPFK